MANIYCTYDVYLLYKLAESHIKIPTAKSGISEKWEEEHMNVHFFFHETMF